MTNPQLEGARGNAQRTYDRRRARSAAETLANIPPNRWDAATRAIILTLATVAAPSRIFDLLEAFDGQPADNLVEIHGGQFLAERMATYPRVVDGLPGAICGSRHHHGTLEQAKACDDLPRADTAEERASIAEARERNRLQATVDRIAASAGCACTSTSACSDHETVYERNDREAAEQVYEDGAGFPWCGSCGGRHPAALHDNGDYRA